MTTPRDVAHRIHEPGARVRRDPSTEFLTADLLDMASHSPLYTSQNPDRLSRRPARSGQAQGLEQPGLAPDRSFPELTATVITDLDATVEDGGGPSPAQMPKKPTDPSLASSFASLEAHDLPMTREYSAGGLVFNEADEVALIARRSRSGHLEWCMPKGHLEKGETPEQAAIREIHEETGILGSITGSIATIDYWFTSETNRIHKLVHHYALQQVSGELSIKGDPDHEAEDVAWVPFSELASVLSYPNERRIVWLYSRKYRSR